MADTVTREEIKEVMDLLSLAYSKMLILIEKYEATEPEQHDIDPRIWTSTVSGQNERSDMGASC